MIRRNTRLHIILYNQDFTGPRSLADKGRSVILRKQANDRTTARFASRWMKMRKI